MATQTLTLAKTQVGKDSGSVVVVYDDKTLEILEVKKDFAGEAHFKFGIYTADKLSVAEKVDYLLPTGLYLEETKDGLQLSQKAKEYIWQ